jgi:hypothetical protein
MPRLFDHAREASQRATLMDGMVQTTDVMKGASSPITCSPEALD